MARLDPNQSVALSLLERLVDNDPQNSKSEAAMSRAQSVRQLKAGLKRDLEWLLNTRRRPDEAKDSYPELRNSMYNYGLPDLTHYSINSARDMNRLAWLLEGCIGAFEPRLNGIKVLMEPLTDGSRMLRFTIEGMLRMDPAPERVSFDTVLELTSGTYQVKGVCGA
jgi:type VI secretion system protein ImpF